FVNRVWHERAQLEAVEERVALRSRQRREQALPGAGRVQRYAVADRGEEAHDLRARHGLDVHRGEIVEDDEVRRLPRRLGDGAEDRPCAQAQLAVARAPLAERRELRAGVIAARLVVLPDVAAAEQRGQEAVDGRDVEAGARGERGDAHLAVGGDERLEQVERAVDRLDGATWPLGRERRLFHFTQAPFATRKA